MPRPFNKDEKQAITSRLIEAGHKLFSVYGLKKTNVEELALAAGISKGAFYLFYDSKESLLMDVVEQAELRFRQEVLTAIEQPGGSPRERLTNALRKAFSLWKTMPILRMFTRAEYEMIASRLPAEKVHQHRQSDQAFIEELIARSQVAGIPITAAPKTVNGLLLSAFFVSLHEDDIGPENYPVALGTLLELIAAYCLGEVSMVSITKGD